MDRIACAAAIRDALSPTDIVICALGSVNRSWRGVNAPQASYFCSDPMGISLAIALGVALSAPDRRVIALCGDGDMLMGLSSLATVAGADAANLRIILFNNGRYETGGGQPLASRRLCFASVARGVGFDHAETADVENELAARIAALLTIETTGLLVLSIDAEPLGYAPPPDVSQAEERALFMRRLAETAP